KAGSWVMSADCVALESYVDHPRVTLWKLLGEPELYPRFVSGLGSFDKIEPVGRERRDQFRIRIVLGEYDDVVEQQVQVLINRAGEQLVFAGVPDTGGQVSLRLLDHKPGQTLVRMVFFKPSLRHP